MKKFQSVGNSKVTKYIEEKVAYLLFLSFSCLGFVVGFFIGNVT